MLFILLVVAFDHRPKNQWLQILQSLECVIRQTTLRLERETLKVRPFGKQNPTVTKMVGSHPRYDAYKSDETNSNIHQIGNGW